MGWPPRRGALCATSRDTLAALPHGMHQCSAALKRLPSAVHSNANARRAGRMKGGFREVSALCSYPVLICHGYFDRGGLITGQDHTAHPDPSCQGRQMQSLVQARTLAQQCRHAAPASRARCRPVACQLATLQTEQLRASTCTLSCGRKPLLFQVRLAPMLPYLTKCLCCLRRRAGLFTPRRTSCVSVRAMMDKQQAAAQQPALKRWPEEVAPTGVRSPQQRNILVAFCSIAAAGIKL